MSVMIRPIIPTVPRHFTQIGIDNILPFLVVMCIVLLATLWVGIYATGELNGNKRKTTIAFIGIVSAVTILLCCFFGFAVSTLKGAILCLLLVFSSYSDIKKREVPDYVHIMVLLTALIGMEVNEVPIMLLTMLLISVPIFIISFFCKSKMIGGADIKLIIACSAVLGLYQAYIGITIGLIIAIIANLKKRKKQDGFPLVPYLAAGLTAAYFI